MQTLTTVDAVRALIRTWRQSEQTVAFVPTMGNLHDGHMRLVEIAHQQADRVVVSIFVNPAQFAPNEDFDSYPRTEKEDKDKLVGQGADLLFLPGVAEMYPQASQTKVSVPDLSALHCGVNRPGHFDGVALVVCKLLNIVQPDVLLLGEKDFQQLVVLRRMVLDLNLPVRVQGVATVREDSGLAMSSRNSYLSDEERTVAPLLFQCLCGAREAVLAGEPEQAMLQRQQQILSDAGFVLDYFSLCRSADLLPPDADDTDLVVMAAARLGKTRLIDNIHFSRK
ncbi:MULTISPECIES: pantoate--beta-alanine ligase [Methylomonas]|uniref:pantoate--beta-alanine ligase n=1 Tax=Methylomonas TaxID=416 RepID=UPI0012320FE9|nr:pantoate--beta-alanine ligase [Methylomonas rhizoryzae]